MEHNTRRVIIKLIDGTTIKGETNIKHHSRLSDALNMEKERFLTVSGVSMHGREGKVVFINKHQIMWAMPTE